MFEHGPVGNSNDFRDIILRRYYCPRAKRTIFLRDDGEYFGECIGTPNDALKHGFRSAILQAQGGYNPAEHEAGHPWKKPPSFKAAEDTKPKQKPHTYW